MPTDREIWEWIKSHNAYDWNYGSIAKGMLIEVIENTNFAEDVYPGLKEKLITKVKGIVFEDEKSTSK